MAPAQPSRHRTTVKVRFYELDPYNHVNHTNYLSYFETARVELLDEMGLGLDRMKAEGFQIVVVELTARFVAPAGMHDVLTIDTDVVDVRRATSTWAQTMSRRGETVATIEVKAAFVDLEGRPRRLPEAFTAALGAPRGLGAVVPARPR